MIPRIIGHTWGEAIEVDAVPSEIKTAMTSCRFGHQTRIRDESAYCWGRGVRVCHLQVRQQQQGVREAGFTVHRYLPIMHGGTC